MTHGSGCTCSLRRVSCCDDRVYGLQSSLFGFESFYPLLISLTLLPLYFTGLTLALPSLVWWRPPAPVRTPTPDFAPRSDPDLDADDIEVPASAAYSPRPSAPAHPCSWLRACTPSSGMSVRWLHRTLGLILIIPLAITTTTGGLYAYGKWWQHRSKHDIHFLMYLHQGKYMGSALYTTLVGTLTLTLTVMGMVLLYRRYFSSLASRAQYQRMAIGRSVNDKGQASIVVPV